MFGEKTSLGILSVLLCFSRPLCHLFQTLAKVPLPCFYWHPVIRLQLFAAAVKIQEHLPLFSPHPQTLRINKASENEWEERESLTNDVSMWAKFPIIDTIGNYSTYSSPSKWARMFELDRLPLTWLVRSAWGQRSPRRPHGNQGNLAFDTISFQKKWIEPLVWKGGSLLPLT